MAVTFGYAARKDARKRVAEEGEHPDAIFAKSEDTNDRLPKSFPRALPPPHSRPFPRHVIVLECFSDLYMTVSNRNSQIIESDSQSDQKCRGTPKHREEVEHISLQSEKWDASDAHVLKHITMYRVNWMSNARGKSRDTGKVKLNDGMSAGTDPQPMQTYLRAGNDRLHRILRGIESLKHTIMRQVGVSGWQGISSNTPQCVEGFAQFARCRGGRRSDRCFASATCGSQETPQKRENAARRWSAGEKADQGASHVLKHTIMCQVGVSS
ncbi:hypothetical protein C8R43DRAFT_950529 [Mycena crocata]|nr:hypothetical protein C8R43DRAFT_950529 [Mycena crocata]